MITNLSFVAGKDLKKIKKNTEKSREAKVKNVNTNAFLWKGISASFALTNAKSNHDRTLRIWLQLLFKVLFTWNRIKMMFFYFLKIIFDISASK